MLTEKLYENTSKIFLTLKHNLSDNYIDRCDGQSREPIIQRRQHSKNLKLTKKPSEDTMDHITTGLLNITHFVAEVQRLMRNSTHGLRNVVNNKGIIVGNEIRFPLVDIDGEAQPINDGADTVPSDLYADTAVANIVLYEAATKLNRTVINATNSAAPLRANAAMKVVHQMENRFTRTILDALMQYDDVDMEVGDNKTPFTIDTLHLIGLKAGKNNWGERDRYLLLPTEAEYTLKQDPKFYEIWSIYNGGKEVTQFGKRDDMDDSIRWVPYGGFMIAFMNIKDSKNAVGLPVAEDGALMGFAFKGSRVGFGMNQAMETRIFEATYKQGNPIVFKTNGSCGASIIDKSAVIGIKMDPSVS